MNQVRYALRLKYLGDYGYLQGQGYYILTMRGVVRYDEDEWFRGYQEEMDNINSLNGGCYV